MANNSPAEQGRGGYIGHIINKCLSDNSTTRGAGQNLKSCKKHEVPEDFSLEHFQSTFQALAATFGHIGPQWPIQTGPNFTEIGQRTWIGCIWANLVEIGGHAPTLLQKARGSERCLKRFAVLVLQRLSSASNVRACLRDTRRATGEHSPAHFGHVSESVQHVLCIIQRVEISGVGVLSGDMVL